MVKNRRLVAQRKFAEGTYVRSLNPLNATSIPPMNASHKAGNAPGPVFVMQNNASEIFTKMSLRRAHEHDDWVVRFKYDNGFKSTPPDTKKKCKEKKHSKHKSFKQNIVIRKNPRRGSDVTTDCESDVPLSSLNRTSDGEIPQETSASSLVQEETSSPSLERELTDELAETQSPSASNVPVSRQNRSVKRGSGFLYFAENSSTCSTFGDRTIDQDYMVPKKAKKKKSLNNKACIKTKVPKKSLSSLDTVETDTSGTLLSPNMNTPQETCAPSLVREKTCTLSLARQTTDELAVTRSPPAPNVPLIRLKRDAKRDSMLDCGGNSSTCNTDRISIDKDDVCPGAVSSSDTIIMVSSDDEADDAFLSLSMNRPQKTCAPSLVRQETCTSSLARQTSDELALTHSPPVPNVPLIRLKREAKRDFMLDCGGNSSTCSSLLDRTIDKDDVRPIRASSDDTLIMVSTKDKKRKTLNLKNSTAPRGTDDETGDAFLPPNTNSMPLEVSYEQTADWVRSHYQSPNTQANANNHNTLLKIESDCKVVLKDGSITRNRNILSTSGKMNCDNRETDSKAIRVKKVPSTSKALTKPGTSKVGEGAAHFKVPRLPARFTKLCNKKKTGKKLEEALREKPTNARNMEETPKQTPNRRLRSSKLSTLGGKKIARPLTSSFRQTRKAVMALDKAVTNVNQTTRAACPVIGIHNDSPAETNSNEPRRMVLCLTPLEKTFQHCLAQTNNPVMRLNINEISPHQVQNVQPRSASGIQLNVNTNNLHKAPISKGNEVETPTLGQSLGVDKGCSGSLQSDPEPSLHDLKVVSSSTVRRIKNDFPSKFQPLLAPASSTNIPAKLETSESLLVFRPTPDEFKDPIAYIRKLQEKAKPYGICKIIPPKGFNIPSNLDESVKFTTVSQYLGRLNHRWGPTSRELAFIQTYVATLANAREGDQIVKAPLYDGVEVDLVKLYHVVLEEGGIEKMLADSENWTSVAAKMGYASKPEYKKLETLYCKHVLPYESLSHHDRVKIQEKVDKVWADRAISVMRRVRRPLHYHRRLLGDTMSDDDEESPIDPKTDYVKIASKQCFDRIEECTGKGRPTNLANYRRNSNKLKAARFADGPEPTTLDVEDEYWGIVMLGTEHTSVLSGFIDTSVKNLGHPEDPNAPGGSHPWNLKRLTENPGNILSSLGKLLSVTVPTLCLQQVFSTNCWHMDPHQLDWMDFMHEGPTKIWYGVAKKDALDFRNAVLKSVPSVVHNKGIWLASDTLMVPVRQLLKCGVQVQRVEQNAGEYIVVFSGAYASSIATGLTISESIYFADMDFITKLDSTFLQMRLDCEPAMFSSTILLMRMADNPSVSCDVLKQVYSLLKAILSDEYEARREAKKLNCEITLSTARGDAANWPMSWPYQEECSICRAPLILSKSIRYGDPRSLMCLKHALRMYTCIPNEEKGVPPPVTLLYSEAELTSHVIKLEHRLMTASVTPVQD